MGPRATKAVALSMAQNNPVPYVKFLRPNHFPCGVALVVQIADRCAEPSRANGKGLSASPLRYLTSPSLLSFSSSHPDAKQHTLCRSHQIDSQRGVTPIQSSCTSIVGRALCPVRECQCGVTALARCCLLVCGRATVQESSQQCCTAFFASVQL